MDTKKRKISFPKVGNYQVVFEFVFTNVFSADYVRNLPITKRTLELGTKSSPDFVCTPFKYQLGNYIEALEAGADTLVQVGGVCRLGYYGELHEQILKDLGYKFDFINLAEMDITKPQSVWSELKRFNKDLSLKVITQTVFTAIEMLRGIDFVENFIRENVGFEVYNGSFDRLLERYLKNLGKCKTKKEVKRLFKDVVKELHGIMVDKPKELLKVGIIGEYYTIQEPYSNHYIEKELSSKGIVVTRPMNMSTSLFGRNINKILSRIKKYVKYNMGATSIDTVDEALQMIQKKYDGIIHVKSFGCTPEIDTMAVLQNISNEHKIPILYFSFDSQTSETGIKTRLEAFYDMIVMRKEGKK